MASHWPISSHFFPLTCTIGTGAGLSQRIVENFSIGHSHLGLTGVAGARRELKGRIQISALATIVHRDGEMTSRLKMGGRIAPTGGPPGKRAQTRARNPAVIVLQILLILNNDKEKKTTWCLFLINQLEWTTATPLCWGRRTRGKKWESADKPGSVVGNHSSGIRVTAYLKQPTREHVWATRAARSRLPPYLALLQAGFTVPSSVATDAVRSYRTLSPLPAPSCEGA